MVEQHEIDFLMSSIHWELEKLELFAMKEPTEELRAFFLNIAKRAQQLVDKTNKCSDPYPALGEVKATDDFCEGHAKMFRDEFKSYAKSYVENPRKCLRETAAERLETGIERKPRPDPYKDGLHKNLKKLERFISKEPIDLRWFFLGLAARAQRSADEIDSALTKKDPSVLTLFPARAT